VVWRILHKALNISPSKNITNLSGNWLAGVFKQEKAQIRVGFYDLLSAMRNVRNDYIFNKAKTITFM
jgi:hypothetical protein